VAIDAAGDWNQIPALLASMPQDLLPQLHLALTGGSTAAAVLAQMGGRSFAVAREFAPGVVTLRPTTTGPAAVTIKPGSYAWPDSFFDWITA
jgi:uncharacterized protein YgbK (DUF1537 family)